MEASPSKENALERLLESDALLMGRHTYEMFSKFWPGQTGEYPSRINSMQKYVFSSTLQRAEWPNTSILSGDVITEAKKLKQQDGHDLSIYGHGLLGQTLLEKGLLDELRVTIFPVVVGHGKLLFRENEHAKLRFAGANTFSSGAHVVRYTTI